MPAGGPYTLSASSGGDAQEIHDVLVGDVFLCTGQSNMQVSVHYAANATAEIAAAKDDQVRELAVDRVPSAGGAEDLHLAGGVESGIAADRGRFLRQLFLFRARIAQACESADRAGDGRPGAARGCAAGSASRPCARSGFFIDDTDMLALRQTRSC